MRILVAGATGYVGGRLVPRLLAAGHEVRCLARNPAKLALQPWRDRVEIVRGDVLDAVSLKEAATGCDAAFYLVHSMGSGGEFASADRVGATNFKEASDEAGLHRIVYLGGLAREPERSPHMSSRHEVGRVLASGVTPVTELRAGVIIGSGSLSFEMLRYLTEVLPIMVTPRWVRTRCQPVAIGDVLDALVDALDGPAGSSVIEIGGPDVLTYRDMMRIYADEAGLRRRLVIPVPVLTPRLSSLWVGLVTPLPAAMARPLVESLRTEVVVDADAAHSRVGPTPYRAAIRRALARLPGGVITRWSDADAAAATASPADPQWSGGTLFMDRQVVPTDTDDDHLFWAFSRIGGSSGYYGMDWAWKVRGLLDQLVGGVGLRRGRRHPTDVRIGEAIDFWRVEDVVPGVSMRLRAEMRLPGDAWLEWEARHTDRGSDLVQTAWFRPRGILGRFYWYVMLPGHRIVFPRMARRIAAAAEERSFNSW
jgi:uncharacterized protein YbjT (DUF2867 family)